MYKISTTGDIEMITIDMQAYKKTLTTKKIVRVLKISFIAIVLVLSFMYCSHLDQQMLQAGLIH